MDGFIGEIRLFAGIYDPLYWILCDGRVLDTRTFQLLYAVIGNTYGGDGGKNTFALPDLRGRAPMGVGQGTGLTDRRLNDQTGTAAETLYWQQMPSHAHTISGVPKISPATVTNNPQGNAWANTGSAIKIYAPQSNSEMSSNIVSNAGGGNGAHTNIQPCVGINYYICYQGIFPAPE